MYIQLALCIIVVIRQATASQPAIHYAFAVSLPHFLQPLLPLSANTAARSPSYGFKFKAAPVELLAEGERGCRSGLRRVEMHAFD